MEPFMGLGLYFHICIITALFCLSSLSLAVPSTQNAVPLSHHQTTLYLAQTLSVTSLERLSPNF